MQQQYYNMYTYTCIHLTDYTCNYTYTYITMYIHMHLFFSWDDDVIFKNCARDSDDSTQVRIYIPIYLIGVLCWLPTYVRMLSNIQYQTTCTYSHLVCTNSYSYLSTTLAEFYFVLQGKGFINDTIRSEFHRKFMDKYIR